MYMFSSVCMCMRMCLWVPMLWELEKVSICVILNSLLPTGFLTKSTYTPTLKFNGVTGMLCLPLFELDSKIYIQYE